MFDCMLINCFFNLSYTLNHIISQPGGRQIAYFTYHVCDLSAPVRLNMVILCFLRHIKTHQQINLSSYKNSLDK